MTSLSVKAMSDHSPRQVVLLSMKRMAVSVRLNPSAGTASQLEVHACNLQAPIYSENDEEI